MTPDLQARYAEFIRDYEGCYPDSAILKLVKDLRACSEPPPPTEKVKDAVSRALARVVADGGEERFISAGYEAHDAIVEAVCEELKR